MRSNQPPYTYRCGSFDAYENLVGDLESKLKVATDLLKLVSVQDHGRIHNWAGMWADCETCKTAFAYSWNWSPDPEDPPPTACPYCRVRHFVKQINS